MVIPAYQAEAFLGETLQALQAQSLPDWEAWVVDDGSTDGTATLARQWADQDSRIHVLEQPNQGPAAARNLALARCQAPFVLFLDSDDLLLPHALARLVAVLEAKPQALAIYGRYETFGSGHQPTAPPLNREGTFRHRMLACVPQGLHISTFLVRREAVHAIGGWDESLSVSADWMFWVALGIAHPGQAVMVCDELTLRVRRHGGQLSRQIVRMEADMVLAQRKARRQGAYRSWAYYRRCRSIFALVLAASYIRNAGRWGAGLRCALEALMWHPGPVVERLLGLLVKRGGAAGL